MPLITAAEAKALLQLAPGDNSKDTLISTLIPLVQLKITLKTNNLFLDIGVQLIASTVAFVAGTPATITDTEAGFLDAGFVGGLDVYVQGSLNNNGVYSVATAVAGTLTLATGETLNAETMGDGIAITKVAWPADIKIEAAQLIGYYLAKQGKLVSQESLPGGVAFTYKTEDEVFKIFNKYKRPFR